MDNLSNLFKAGFPLEEFCSIPGQNVFITAALIGSRRSLETIRSHDFYNTLPINGRDRNGRNALHMACLSGDPEKIEYLLSLGAEPESRTNGG